MPSRTVSWGRHSTAMIRLFANHAALVCVSQTSKWFVRHEPWRAEVIKAGSVQLQDLHSAHPLAVTIPISCLRQLPAG